MWVGTMKGLGWGTGLTVKTRAQRSVGSEARKPRRLQTVLEREESAIQVGFWGRNGAAPRNSWAQQDLRFHQQGKETLAISVRPPG